jgi:hypothetical protein
MSTPSNGDLMQALGRIEAGQMHAEKARGVLHGKIDEITKTVQDLRLDVRIVADVAKQAREEAKAIKVELDDELKPSLLQVGEFRTASEPVIRNMKSARNAILALVGVLGIMGLGTGAVLAFANDYARTAVIYWLNDGGAEIRTAASREGN